MATVDRADIPAMMTGNPLPSDALAVALGALRPAWHARAACRGQGCADWFSGDGEAARALCARCPVMDECAAYAYAERPTHGVWAGINAKDLRRRAAA